mmetsp:Transcript_60914/g.178067  ORF Transcript_60914/g.178067 Transcript_60914/m.178067 type:complete len:294 (+) Transcript_60914:76-957(+)
MGAYCIRAVNELEDENGPSKLATSLPFTASPPGDDTPLVEAHMEGGRSTSRRSRDREKVPMERADEDQHVALLQSRASWPLGTGPSQEPTPPRVRWSKSPTVPVPVTLHIYDIGTSGGGHFINALLKPLGTGAFHCGVEVYGCEWSYSDTTSGVGDGIFCSQPRCCEGHTYCESVSMGRTGTAESEVLQLIDMLKADWPVSAYDVLAHNCCHFCDEFCQRLGVGSIPPWVMNLAGAGAAVAAAGDTTCCRQVVLEVAHGPCCPEPATTAGGMPVEVIEGPGDEHHVARRLMTN